MKRNRELILNTFIITVGKISTQIINFLLLPLYTSKLNPSEYGNYDFITTISNFAIPFVTMLLEESMFRFLIDAKSENEKKRIISLTFIYSIISCTLLGIISLIFTKLFSYNLGIYIILYTISVVFMGLSNALARGEGKIKLYSLSNFFLSLLTIILNLVLILCFNFGFAALIISTVFSHIFVSLLVLIKLKIWRYISFKNIDFKHLKKMLQYSIPLVPNTVCWAVINASDRLVVMSTLGSSYNGIYSVSYKFPNIINNFYGYFNIAWRETSAKIANDGSLKEFNNIYKNIKNLLFAITICLIAIMPFAYPVFIDEAYISGIYYVPILAISIFYTSISGFYGGIFTAFKETKILGITSFVAAIINLVVDVMLIRYIGLYAAAISTFAASYIIYLYRKCKVKDYAKLDDNNILYFILFGILLIFYYIDNDLLHLLILILCISVSIMINFNIISKIVEKVRHKFIVRKKA